MNGIKENSVPQWFNSIVFEDEAIIPRAAPGLESLPDPLKKARTMERAVDWESRQAVFLKQGKFLADYEDDYLYDGDPVRYYPTYQSLTNEELRGYFSWRSKVRKGRFPATSLSFIFLYIYELINQIGVKDPMAGYNKLARINREYGALENKIPRYLNQWLIDYIVYYNLDRSLLRDNVQVVNDQCARVLENVHTEQQNTVLEAVRRLAPRWLGRSRFYSEHYEDMDKVIFEVLRKVADHYAKGFKKTMIEQFFGRLETRYIHMFSASVFCNPLNRIEYEYRIDDQYIYKCEQGIWTVSRRVASPRGIRRLEDLLKTVDAVMRNECGYKHPIKEELKIKWLIKIIREEIQALVTEKRQRKLVAFDFSQLPKIRDDASITARKLIVEDELPEEELPASGEEPADASGLSADEYRLLHSLLYDEDTGWLRKEGFIAAVLVDSINGKLYDAFGDSVLDDSLALVEDYIDDLKEIIHP